MATLCLPVRKQGEVNDGVHTFLSFSFTQAIRVGHSAWLTQSRKSLTDIPRGLSPR